MGKDISVTTPSAYTISKCDLINIDGDRINIRRLLGGFNITESIYSMFSLYTFHIVDAVGLLEKYGVTGNEKIELELIKRSSDGYSSNQILKKLSITGYSNLSKPSNESQAYTITAISETGFLAAIDRVSRTVSGTIHSIIQTLYSEIEYELPLKVVNANTEGRYTGALPNFTYINTLIYLLTKAQDTQGDVFHLYETLWENDTKFNSYNNMVSSEPIDTYMLTNNINNDEEKDLEQDRYDRMRLKILSINSMLGLSNFNGFKSGTFKAQTHSLDIATKTYKVVDFDLLNSNVPIMSKDYLVSDKYTIGNKSYGDIKKASVYTVNTNSKAYNNTLNFNGNSDSSIASKKALFGSQFAVKHSIELPGDINIEAGKTINIKIPSAFDASGVSEHTDDLLSGKHVITDIVHKFNPNGSYTVDLALKRNSVDRDLMMAKYKKYDNE